MLPQGARAPFLSHLTTKNDRILTPEPLPGLSVLIEAALYDGSLVQVAACGRLG
jgi:hypothetical protein